MREIILTPLFPLSPPSHFLSSSSRKKPFNAGPQRTSNTGSKRYSQAHLGLTPGHGKLFKPAVPQLFPM